jgi:hypothetical protein
MKLSPSDLAELKTSFNACRIAGIDSVMITDNQIRGISANSKMAIISPIKISIDSTIKIGISRLSELEKRLSVFSDEAYIDGTLNKNNEVLVLTMKLGKSSLQFRCTAESMIKYPKENEDTEDCSIVLNKTEVSQITKAVKTLGAEMLTIAIARDGSVSIQCTSPANETFCTTLDSNAEFVQEVHSVVQMYDADKLTSVLDAATRDLDEIPLIIGEYGSLTFMFKTHVLIAMPATNQENDDE